MQEPAIGARVLVRPHPNIRVQEHGNIPGRIMADAWNERVWDEWLHRRFRTGEIMVKPVEDVPGDEDEPTGPIPTPAVPAEPAPVPAPEPEAPVAAAKE